MKLALFLFACVDAQLAVCTAGALLRVQNAHVRMVKGFMRLVVDKWSTVKTADAVEFDTVKEDNNVSKVEFELAA
jgi:hypothetical protein